MIILKLLLLLILSITYLQVFKLKLLPVQQVQSIFLFSEISTLAWSPLSLLYSGYRGSCLGIKQLELAVDHSFLYSARLRMSAAMPLLLFCLYSQRGTTLILLYILTLGSCHYYVIHESNKQLVLR